MRAPRLRLLRRQRIPRATSAGSADTSGDLTQEGAPLAFDASSPRLAPRPIGAWFHEAQRERFAAKAPSVAAARALALPAFDPLSAPAGTGAAALREFARTFGGAAPPIDSPAWAPYMDAAFGRGLIALRDAGVRFRTFGEKRVAELGAGGEHPFGSLLSQLAERGFPVLFAPELTEGKYTAGVIRLGSGRSALVLGTHALLDLDPNAPVIAHERYHLEGPKDLGASPHGARFVASAERGRLPGPAHWELSTFQAGDEPPAYLAGIVKWLERAIASARAGDGKGLAVQLHEARADIISGLECALRNAAVAKQALGALERGTLERLVGGTLEADEQALRVTRRDGSAYDIILRHGALTCDEVSAHLRWQLRAAHEELAIFRVLGQALELARDMPALDVRVLEAALAVASRRQASQRVGAEPLSYEEMLHLFNDRAASTT